jgi:inner membrane protein
MGRTHALLGVCSLWLLQPLPGALTSDTLAPLALLAAFGALLPDLDARGSTLKYWRIGGVTPFVPLSELLHKSFGHRGLLHSLRGLGAASLLALPLLWLGWLPFLALALGYASHLAGDASTKSGIPLLYPRTRRFHLLPRPWRLTTGSQAEDALLPVLGAAVLALLLHLPFFASS